MTGRLGSETAGGLPGQLLRGVRHARAAAAAAPGRDRGRGLHRRRRLHRAVGGAGAGGARARGGAARGREGRLGGVGAERRADRQRAEREPRDDRGALRRRASRPSSRRWCRKAARIIRERVAKYAIACDLKDGNVFTAFTPSADARAGGASRRCGGGTGTTTSSCSTGPGCAGASWRATPISAACSTAAAGTCIR